MKKNSINKAVLLSLTILSCNTIQCKEKALEEVNVIDQLQLQMDQLQIKETTTIKLSASQVKGLNLYLDMKPGLIIQMKRTNQASEKVIATLGLLTDTNTKEDVEKVVDECKKQVLSPAGSLFKELYKFKLLAEPMLKQFLITNKEGVDDTISLSFFKIDKAKKDTETLDKEFKSFFDTAFSDKENLIKGCNEFLKVCQAFLPHIDESVMKKADDLVKQLQKKNKK